MATVQYDIDTVHTDSASYTELGPPDKIMPQIFSPDGSFDMRTEAST
jgi:hypothetical protein